MIDDKENTAEQAGHIGPNVTLFNDRCIMCTRFACASRVRLAGGGGPSCRVVNAASRKIDIFHGIPLDNKLASNVVDLMPRGRSVQQGFFTSSVLRS